MSQSPTSTDDERSQVLRAYREKVMEHRRMESK